MSLQHPWGLIDRYILFRAEWEGIIRGCLHVPRAEATVWKQVCRRAKFAAYRWLIPVWDLSTCQSRFDPLSKVVFICLDYKFSIRIDAKPVFNDEKCFLWSETRNVRTIIPWYSNNQGQTLMTVRTHKRSEGEVKLLSKSFQPSIFDESRRKDSRRQDHLNWHH